YHWACGRHAQAHWRRGIYRYDLGVHSQCDRRDHHPHYRIYRGTNSLTSVCRARGDTWSESSPTATNRETICAAINPIVRMMIATITLGMYAKIVPINAS